MKRNELTKTFEMLSNLKNSLVSIGFTFYKKYFSAVRVNVHVSFNFQSNPILNVKVKPSHPQ